MYSQTPLLMEANSWFFVKVVILSWVAFKYIYVGFSLLLISRLSYCSPKHCLDTLEHIINCYQSELIRNVQTEILYPPI